MTPAEFEAWRAHRLARLDAALDAALPPADCYPSRLHRAMRYACEGGKRLRGLLVYATGDALGVAAERLDAAAVAVELIHAFSLVHDDLPAMDNDDLRRGRATVHKAFDEGTAILVGDALQTLAFAQLSTAPGLSPSAALESLRLLAAATGSQGMSGGQQADLEAEGELLSLDALERLHAHKTGALILVCPRLAAAPADATADQRERLDVFGTALGLAYQIQDDVLDITASSARLGKTAGKDVAAAKSTFVQLLGLEAAQQRADELLQEALDQLGHFGPEADALRALTCLIAQRRH